MQRTRPVAIIDIGSNSVRLVAYAGRERVPAVVFNEKVLAGLGKEVGATGRISAESWASAIGALKRYKLLIRHMGARQVQIVATAAVRDASNGPEFVDAIQRIGLDCRVISAEEEAWLAGEGVLSAIPGADGIVGDLGGGSLELVEVGQGRANRGISLPLGVLRAEASPDGEKRAAALLRTALRDSELAERCSGRTLYLVGGSWRAVAKVDMIARDFPLPVVLNYALAPERIAALRTLLASPDPEWSRQLSAARLASAPVAAMLLDLLARELRPVQIVVSNFGIREGLLFAVLKEAVRQQDPLTDATRRASAAPYQLGAHGDALDAWIAPLFEDEPARARLRLASCLLVDSAAPAAPDFRADRAVETALHGSWIGVTPAERVIIAQALSSSFGHDRLPDPRLADLCTEEALVRAHQWGSAMRLGRRLSAGLTSVLEQTELARSEDTIELRLPKRQAALLSESVHRRLRRLAKDLGLEPRAVLR